MNSQRLVRFFLLLVLSVFCSISFAQHPGNQKKDNNGKGGRLMFQGQVASNGSGLNDYKVSLLASYIVPAGKTEVVGSSRTDSSGEFEIDYKIPMGLPSDKAPIM